MRYNRQTILRRWLRQLASRSDEPPASEAAAPAPASEPPASQDAAPAPAAERSEASVAEPPPASERQRQPAAAGFRLPGEKRSSRKRKRTAKNA